MQIQECKKLKHQKKLKAINAFLILQLKKMRDNETPLKLKFLCLPIPYKRFLRKLKIYFHLCYSN
jgi:hypothetical protein